MQCAACGYQYVTKTELVDEVIYFKSGKRKGEVKDIQKKNVKLVVGHEPFQHLYFKKEVDQLVADAKRSDACWDTLIEVDLYMCPECGTIKGKTD